MRILICRWVGLYERVECGRKICGRNLFSENPETYLFPVIESPALIGESGGSCNWFAPKAIGFIPE